MFLSFENENRQEWNGLKYIKNCYIIVTSVLSEGILISAFEMVLLDGLE